MGVLKGRAAPWWREATQRIELLTQERKRLEKDLGKYERSTQALTRPKQLLGSKTSSMPFGTIRAPWPFGVVRS